MKIKNRGRACDLCDFSLPEADNATYSNNRRSDSSYDGNGNATANASYHNTFDVFGANTQMQSTQHLWDGSSTLEISQTYSADGRPATRTQVMRQNDFNETGDLIGVSEDTLTSHYIYSSVLRARVVELDQNGSAKDVWAYAGGRRIYANGTFEHHNPATGSYVQTLAHPSSRLAIRQERDPADAELPLEAPASGGSYVSSKWDQPLFIDGGDPFDFSGGCSQDGLAVSCSEALHNLTRGTAVVDVSTTSPAAAARIGLVPIYGRFGASIQGEPVTNWTNEITGYTTTGGLTTSIDMLNPQNTGHHEIDKQFDGEFPCNRSANDVMRTIRRNFSKFGNFSEPVLGGLAIGFLTFAPGPITQGRVINISAGAVSMVSADSYGRSMSVTVSSASTMSFTFTTNPGHGFYPGTISFSVRDADGGVHFTIKADGELADWTARRAWNNGGEAFEADAWHHFIDLVRKSCGNAK